MDLSASTRRTIILTAALATASMALTAVLFPLPLSEDALVVFIALLALTFVSELLGLEVTEGGSETSMDFVPQLAAIILLGPTAAGLLTLISLTVYQLAFARKPAPKSIFNTAQFVLSVCLAGMVFVALGGTPNLARLSFEGSVLPFAGAVVAYFAVNSLAVSYIIAVSQEKQVREIWRQVAGGVILFDVAMSPLAYLAAFLYVQWGAAALLAVIIPIIGLRYSYGLVIELKHLNTDLLRVLIKTLEAQDPYTSGHSARVAERARGIADEMGLRHRERRYIETAALLHDIGKIGSVYNQILRQTGPLSSEQQEIIREHPERGVEIIESVRSLAPEILRYVRHHHERVDGDGYPDGLKGEEIPLGARIIMVADTIDAMMSVRPYRDALPAEVVREELLRYSGTQFDTKVVNAALEANVIRHVAHVDQERKEVV